MPARAGKKRGRGESGRDRGRDLKEGTGPLREGKGTTRQEQRNGETETTTEPKNRDRSETRTPYGKRATPSLFGGISSWAEFPVPLDLDWTNDGFECSLLFDLVDSSKLF